jgi:hypothetical protein
MTAGVACKFTVHFSTSFSTTRTSFRKMTVFSCRTSHSRLRHFLDDFGASVVLADSRVNLEQANYFLACYSDTGVVTTFSSFRSSDLSQSI